MRKCWIEGRRQLVQAFVTRMPSARSRALNAPSPPIKELFGMHKVFLHPGESTEITFSSKSSSGARPFSTTFQDGRKALVPGDFLVAIGVGAGQIVSTWRVEGNVIWI